MAVLLLADVNDGALAADAVGKTLAAVAALGEVHVLVAGTGGDAAAAEAAKLAGVAKVLFADDHAYCHGMAESTAALIVSLAASYSHICGAATAFNKNVLPRVAATMRHTPTHGEGTVPAGAVLRARAGAFAAVEEAFLAMRELQHCTRRGARVLS